MIVHTLVNGAVHCKLYECKSTGACTGHRVNSLFAIHGSAGDIFEIFAETLSRGGLTDGQDCAL